MTISLAIMYALIIIDDFCRGGVALKYRCRDFTIIYRYFMSICYRLRYRAMAARRFGRWLASLHFSRTVAMNMPAWLHSYFTTLRCRFKPDGFASQHGRAQVRAVIDDLYQRRSANAL